MAAVRPHQQFAVGDVAVVGPFDTVDMFGRRKEYALKVTSVRWQEEELLEGEWYPGEWIYGSESYDAHGFPVGTFFMGDISRRPLLRIGARITEAGWTAGSIMGWVVAYDTDYGEPPTQNSNAGRLRYTVARQLDTHSFADDLLRC